MYIFTRVDNFELKSVYVNIVYIMIIALVTFVSTLVNFVFKQFIKKTVEFELQE
ncbi:hypothetical protein psyc5s11_42560 [Clostridium gelidum]|uniref:Uncharacterized protein n=1 Tax=Clostridium gelidum TaxID=704125 RepID=A0ABN6J1F8_9CLOT|nr:hypothetical protein psyc5s11_42560 [Clostridium gelidum]